MIKLVRKNGANKWCQQQAYLVMTAVACMIWCCNPVLSLLSNTRTTRQQVFRHQVRHQQDAIMVRIHNKHNYSGTNTIEWNNQRGALDLMHKMVLSSSSSLNSRSRDYGENDSSDVEQSRRSLITTSFSAALVALSNLPQPSTSATIPPVVQQQTILTLPLSKAGGAYFIYYRVDSALFRAVLDTGSPFLMIPGSCSQNTRAKTGCYRQQGVPSGLATTFEQFDGFEGEVEWRRAPFSFVNATGTGSMIVSSPTVVFGVADDNVMSGPGGVFFGLVKETDAWIRPSFLGQTGVTSFIIDLRKNANADDAKNDVLEIGGFKDEPRPSLALSTVPFLSSMDYIPMTKALRRVGDPVQHYVSKLKSITINGTPLIPKDKRPIYAIFDTGVTGMVMSRELYDQRYMEARERRERKLWGGEVQLTFETARKNIKTITAVKPLTTPFDPKANWKNFRGHVIVLGLSFLDEMKLTVDIDDGRIWME